MDDILSADPFDMAPFGKAPPDLDPSEAVPPGMVLPDMPPLVEDGDIWLPAMPPLDWAKAGAEAMTTTVAKPRTVGIFCIIISGDVMDKNAVLCPSYTANISSIWFLSILHQRQILTMYLDCCDIAQYCRDGIVVDEVGVSLGQVEMDPLPDAATALTSLPNSIEDYWAKGRSAGSLRATRPRQKSLRQMNGKPVKNGQAPATDGMALGMNGPDCLTAALESRFLDIPELLRQRCDGLDLVGLGCSIDGS